MWSAKRDEIVDIKEQ